MHVPPGTGRPYLAIILSFVCDFQSKRQSHVVDEILEKVREGNPLTSHGYRLVVPRLSVQQFGGALLLMGGPYLSFCFPATKFVDCVFYHSLVPRGTTAQTGLKSQGQMIIDQRVCTQGPKQKSTISKQPREGKTQTELDELGRGGL